jgi:hypothetical protein
MTQFKKLKVKLLDVKESDLWSSGGLQLNYCSGTSLVETDSIYPKHLYILSDEEIKGGDWILDSANKLRKVLKISEDNRLCLSELFAITVLASSCKKIIASTDPSLNLPRPSDSFIKKYCELGGIDEVMVEYIEERNWMTDPYKIWSEFVLKVASDNTITIRSVKDSWNRKEVLSLFEKYALEGDISVDEIRKWIEENI